MPEPIVNTKAPPRSRRSGHAVIEASLLGPWVLFLFMALLDFGFYNYALIATTNAARVAALAATQPSGDDTKICPLVLGELSSLPNVGAQGLSTCATSAAGVGDATPVALILATKTGADSVAGDTTQVATVVYQTIPMIPLPFLTGRLTIVKTAEQSLVQ